MSKLFYAVTATIEDADLRAEYIGWLTGGHIAAVLAGGAERARLVVLDGEGPARVETQYIFPSRGAFEAYSAGPAVPLREDGVRRFGGRGVVFERRIGDVVAEKC